MGNSCCTHSPNQTPVKKINKRNRRHRRSLNRSNEIEEDEPYVLVMNSSQNESSVIPSMSGMPRRRGTTEAANMMFRHHHPSVINWKLTNDDIDKHVIDTLNILRVSAENDTDLILRMRMFRFWANGETGWNMVLNSLIRAIPLDDALGPSAITLFIDHCPLPTKNSVASFVSELKLSRDKAKSDKAFAEENRSSPQVAKNALRHRNICAVLGHLAERLAGDVSSLIMTQQVLEYILETIIPLNRNTDINTLNILYSLIALEKFSQTRGNKSSITEANVFELLQTLEKWLGNENFKKRQVGFAAQWLLDNIFVKDSRPYTYEQTDLSDINAILNSNDVSEYLKIAPTGLEARSDASSFESVRCTFAVDEGVWFYEVTVVTTGVMQIGWATKQSKFLNYDGYGIGDDEFSCAYDGCRQLFWFQAQSRKHAHRVWKEGDTLGLLLDLDKQEVIFYLDGDALPPEKCVFKWARSGFFAAASFMSFQQCIFNFGATPFKFPPTDRKFKSFNDHAHLTDEEKIVLPRHKKLQLVRLSMIDENSCSLCCDKIADTTLLPCGHGGICMACAEQLTCCHLCRQDIADRKIEEEKPDAINE